MKKSSLLLVLLFFISCGTSKYIPTDTKEVIVYRDSIIYLKDTIKIDVPKIIVKEVVPMVDTSYLKTEIAESIAFLDTLNKEIVHTLEQKGKLKAPIDTLLVVEYKDREIEKEIIKEVEIEVPKYNGFFYFLLSFFVLCLLYFIFKILN